MNLAVGFGFNGFDRSGKPRWDLMENVSIWDVEVRPFFCPPLCDAYSVLWLANLKSNHQTGNKMEELAKKSVTFLVELDKKSVSASVSCLSLPRKVCVLIELAKKSVTFLFELDKKSVSASVSCLSLPRKVCVSCLSLPRKVCVSCLSLCLCCLSLPKKVCVCVLFDLAKKGVCLV